MDICILNYGNRKYGFIYSKEKKLPKEIYEASKKKDLMKKIENDKPKQPDENTNENTLEEQHYNFTKGLSELDIHTKEKINDDDLDCGTYLEELTGYIAGNEDRMLLMLHMLSGQVYRKLKDAKVWPSMIRPILRIVPGKAGHIHDYMKKIAQRFCRDWTGRLDCLRLVLPVILPVSVMDNDIAKDCYIVAKNVKKKYYDKLSCPAYYSDTTVVLNGQLLKNSKIKEFATENPNCVLVICGNPAKNLKEHICASINFEKLIGPDSAWMTKENKAVLKALTVHFGDFLSDKKSDKRIDAAGKWAKKKVGVYSEENPSISTTEKSAKLLYLTTARLLIKWFNGIDEDDCWEKERELLKNQLYNIAVPGCYESDANMLPDGTIPLNSNNFQKVFCETVARMLEDTSRYCFIPSKENCLDLEEMKKEGLYGFLRMHMLDKSHKNGVPSVLFYRETFMKLFLEMCPNTYKCDENILTDLMNPFILNGPYFPKRKKESKDRFAKDINPQASVKLLIDKIDFVPKEKLQELHNKFPDLGAEAGISN